MAPDHSLDSLVNAIINATPNNLSTLANTLRNGLPKESRETIFSSALSGGQDPLSLLDFRVNTLGALYILSARLHTNTSAPPSWAQISDFCRNFAPEQARWAPDRVTLLAKGIVRLAEQNLRSAVEPLLSLVTRYPPSLNYLTTIHTLFISTCVTTQCFKQALPVLQCPITTIDTNLSELHYTDALIYHYAGGIAFTALGLWSEAEEFFEMCASSPGHVPSAVQLEALKKLTLVQLIARGKTSPPLKYTHSSLIRILKNTPYAAFAQMYPSNTEGLHKLIEKERGLFGTEKNFGLVVQALDRAPRWAVKKLTATYLTLGLADIGRAAKIQSEDDVRALVLAMIESKDISAQISADGTVSFSDPPPEFTKADVDRVLANAQEQASLLTALEMELSRNRDYVSKAIKSRDDSWIGAGDDEDYGGGKMGSSGWMEDAGYS